MDIVYARLIKMLIEAATSKKAIATIVGLIAVWLGKKGLALTPEQQQQIVALIMAYVLGQGVADHGKFTPAQRDRLG